MESMQEYPRPDISLRCTGAIDDVFFCKGSWNADLEPFPSVFQGGQREEISYKQQFPYEK